ncbi:MAG: SDR family oxidoreductase [Planctomycetes bacterium]|nr:SDR family oxidoreductase [Planctomycetota bacterium]
MHDISSTLEGQWALVTGSSSGIGRAIALELASTGANVLVHGCNKREATNQLAEQLRDMGVESEALLCDLSQANDRLAFVAQAWQIAPLDIWINNAGVDVLTGEAAHWTFTEKLAALWPVDVVGTIELSRSVGTRMKQRGHGVLLNIGWDQAATGMAGDSGEMFAATKGAVMAFTRSAAKSFAPEVRVNCIAPGWIKTEWGEAASDDWQKRASGESLLQRWGTPEDIAQAACFLVSPDASFITGQILNVNGGQRN